MDKYKEYIFANKKSSYCIVIGVLNEGARIKTQLERMQALRGIADIIIVDGGSSDGATDADFLRDKITALLVVHNSKGLSDQFVQAFGYALKSGYKGIITVDGNNKDGVEAIPEFTNKLESGFDLVQGSRFLPGGRYDNTPPDRVLGIRLIFAPVMSIFSGFRFTDPINGFRGYSTKFLEHPQVQPLRDVFRHYSLQYYLNYRAAKLKFKVCEIPVTRIYPKQGSRPTKINGIAGRLSILQELFKTLTGGYNP